MWAVEWKYLSMEMMWKFLSARHLVHSRPCPGCRAYSHSGRNKWTQCMQKRWQLPSSRMIKKWTNVGHTGTIFCFCLTSRFVGAVTPRESLASHVCDIKDVRFAAENKTAASHFPHYTAERKDRAKWARSTRGAGLEASEANQTNNRVACVAWRF